MFSVTYLVYERKKRLFVAFSKKIILLNCLLKAYYPENKNKKIKKAFILEKDIGM